MNMTLLFPLGLAALAALILPILIHVVRRIDEQLIDFAALRWLQSRVRPRRRPRFDELLLLFLRLLLLAMLALWLAQPLLHGMKPGKPWLLIAPSVPTSALPRDDGKHEVHWLAPGFPRVDAGAAPPAAAQPVASLLREADAVIPQGTHVTVFVPETLDGADAERIALSRDVEWSVVKTPSTTSSEPMAATPPAIALHVSPALTAQARWFAAIDAAWRAMPGVDARPALQSLREQQAPADTQELLVWLDAAPLPAHIHAWLQRGGTVLVPQEYSLPEQKSAGAVLLRDNDAQPVLHGYSEGQGRLLRFSSSLDAKRLQLLADPRFPQLLQEAIAASLPSAPERIHAEIHRPLPGAKPWPVAPRPLQPWIAWVLLGLFCLERLLANAPRREVGR